MPTLCYHLFNSMRQQLRIPSAPRNERCICSYTCFLGAFSLNVELRRVHDRKRQHRRSSNKMLKAVKGISVLLLWLRVGHGHDLAFPSLLVLSNILICFITQFFNSVINMCYRLLTYLWVLPMSHKTYFLTIHTYYSL